MHSTEYSKPDPKPVKSMEIIQWVLDHTGGKYFTVTVGNSPPSQFLEDTSHGTP